ncbi:DUF6929 family protein [Hymenobacter nivis]|uniref:DUF3616 domain-containing protein n=1 Tax=Hymenobacter nivis TaxID=1850093 RepID=A0A502HBY3_9BACT|nr:hypothetical protein [Hymenobacter nivis]TPG72021.1 hypothetical protein EAH73_01895 [Hymenobacter nivis]
MTAVLLSETALPGLPSASGVELVGPTAYVIADDAPFLYALDAATLAPTGRVQLFETTAVVGGRWPKATKPDLEALTACAWPGRGVGLLLLGSGSGPQRRRGCWVPLLPTPGFALAQQPQPLDLTALYAAAQAALPAGAPLNIEAAAATSTELLLLQRGVGAGAAAAVLRLPLAAALAHLAGQGPPPRPVAQAFQLPLIGGSPAGFSGATFAGGRLWVAASVENTADPVLDGEVLGSFVGVIDLAAGTAEFARLAWADGRAYRGKVEGLALRPRQPGAPQELLLVTDDDRGGSTALVATVA